MQSADVIRFAAVGDIHCTKDSAGALRDLFAHASQVADALLLCGDLTDYGLAEEARVLADELGAASVPIVAVLGNHDFESDTPGEVAQILKQAGVHVLDGEAIEIEGVGIAGTKGFVGGYGRGTSRLEEPLIRHPVTAVVHGHAHRGTPEGRTVNGTPVFNVSLPLMREARPERPYRVVEVETSMEVPT